MQCLAGLWWDQQRRTCVLPSEVACNPYNIINSQGQGQVVDNNQNGKNIWKEKNFYLIILFFLGFFQPGQGQQGGVPFPSFDTTPIVMFPPSQPQPQQPGQGGQGMNMKRISIKINFLLF